MDRLSPFPHMNDDSLRTLKKSIDDAFRAFARSYGDRLETLFSPLQTFLIQAKRLMTQTPWPIVLVVIAAIAWVASRSWRIVAGTVATLLSSAISTCGWTRCGRSR